MQRNIRFFAIVIALLLLSFIILTGCMYAIATDNGEMKPYDLSRKKDNISYSDSDLSEIQDSFADQEPIAPNPTESDPTASAPLAQDSLQTKFKAMYDISEDGKIISVISEDYLNSYWRSNYEKEVIHSLTAEEVYFIIQDSIRVYFNYDKVILPGFASHASLSFVAERFPYIEDKEVCRPVTSHLDRERVESDIHTIIMYRLKALSSPKAFFTGEEAMRFAGKDSAAYDDMYHASVLYIPGYSANTDRDYILSVMGGGTNSMVPSTDLFDVSVYGGVEIEFSSIANGSSTKVFPTDKMFYYALDIPDDSAANRDNTTSNNTTGNGKNEAYLPFFRLDIANNTFMMTMSLELSSAISGTYVQKGDALILFPYDGKAPEGYVYFFYYHEGAGYEYAKGESHPVPGYEFYDRQMFTLKDGILAADND